MFIDGLPQDCGNSMGDVLELACSCIRPFILIKTTHYQIIFPN